MIVGVPRETVPGEQRVALVPDLVPKLTAAGLEVTVRDRRGPGGRVPGRSPIAKRARLEADVFGSGRHPPQGAAADAWRKWADIKKGATLIGFLQPYTNRAGIQRPGRAQRSRPSPWS